MKRDSIRLGLVLAAVAVAVAVAPAQRNRTDRAPMSATGYSIPSAERGSAVSGPTLGYAVDASTGTLHMVRGIAGSSLMSDPVHRGGAITVSAISPSAEYAVIGDDAGAVVFYGQATGRSAGRVTLDAPGGALSLAATSPSGDSFVLYSAEARMFAVYPVQNGAVGERRMVTGASVGGDALRIAVADGGNALAVITRDGSGTRVLRIAADGTARSAATLPGVVDLAFFGGSERALLLDASQNALYEADLALANPSLRLVASQAEGLAEPSSLALSADGRMAAVASAARKQAILLDLAASSARQVELPEAPVALRRMNGRAVFQLTDASQGPMLLLDAQGAEPRTVYVPRAVSSRAASAGRADLR